MSTEPTKQPDMATAHRIILVLMETLTASSDLIAQMALMMGEETARGLASHPSWGSYLEAKRKLEAVHDDMHAFADAASQHIARENAAADAAEKAPVPEIESPS